MSASNMNFIRKTIALTALITAYLIAALFRSDAWCNIVAPLNDFAAVGILYFAYRKSDHSNKASVTVLLFTLACAIWGIADIIWATISFSGGNPDESFVLAAIYTLTNGFLFSALIVFVYHQFRKWQIVQFGIDLIISGLLTCVLFWILFLHKDNSIVKTLLSDDFTSMLSIIIDILICISIFTYFLSIRSGKIPVFLRIISFGLVLFAFNDIFYYYIDYHGQYSPSSIYDFLYTFSLIIIAFGALWKTYKSSSEYDFTGFTNVGGRRRWVYLLIYPIVAILFPITGVMSVQINLLDIVTFALLIFLYWASCKYVQVSLEKESLLKHSNELLEQRIADQVSELTFLANQDTLTSLYNRRYFVSCIDDKLKSMHSNDTMALVIIDMDRFKTINDTFGHDVGDRVLIDFSQRIMEWNYCGATIARLGGDEFAVMFVGNYTQKDIEDFCSEIIDTCCRPFNISDNNLSLTMSAGIAISSAEACDGKTLMQNADIAMYQAKSQGYNKYLVFTPIMSQDFKKTAEIEVLLRQTAPDKDFELYFQPQYRLPNMELLGAEALIRWKNPDHGFIPPKVFIPIAEQIDYIFKIGKWVMKETITQSMTWNIKYPFPIKVGFNISPKQIKDKEFVNLIKTLVINSGVNTEWIDAELTESIMLNDEDTVDETLSVLHEMGITVSIDDFGSGYSALGYLNKYSFDRIKIDKSLIDNINSRNISGANVVKAAINMAHASGIQTIAEGVETQEQLDILNELGCDQVQGYHMGRPVPADVFEQRYIKQYCEDAKIC